MDDSLYTGITKDIKRRIGEHNFDNRLGAKSLRNKRPVILVYCELFATQSEAAKREKSIKRWTRKYKLKLIESFRSKMHRNSWGLPSKVPEETFEGP